MQTFPAGAPIKNSARVWRPSGVPVTRSVVTSTRYETYYFTVVVNQPRLVKEWMLWFGHTRL